MRIAIVKLSALGDIVHAMVVLQYIKKFDQDISIDWIIEKLNLIPGIDIASDLPESQKAEINHALSSLDETKRVDNSPSSIVNQISSSNTQSHSGIHVENLEIKTKQVNKSFFEDELTMAAG